MPRNTRRSASSRSTKQTSRPKGRVRSASTRGRATPSTASSRTTTDHNEIRHWVEQRGGLPACVKGTGSSRDTGMIRLEFPGTPNSRDESLQEITWDEFFDKFEDQGLALLYQEKTARGAKSNFNKLVKRNKARTAAAGR